MVSHDQKTWHVTILIDLAELDLGDILQFRDPTQHLAENFNPVSIWAQLQKCLRIQEIVSKCHF